MSVPVPSEFQGLESYLLREARACVRPPVDRFRHPWFAPMPLSEAGAAYLRSRQAGGGTTAHEPGLSRPGSGDGFTLGDYSLGLFHHDASEAAIELLAHDELTEAAAGSLLCLLDCAHPSGRVHRAELPHKSREAEPAKPVLAQFALRAVEALGSEGLAWAERHDLLARLGRFVTYLEREYVGLHGLFLTHSSLQSGFDTDVLSAGFPDRSVEGPDTNAFMVLEYEALAQLAQGLGEKELAARYEGSGAVLKERVERLLWYEDERGGGYSALRWQHGVASLDAERVGARQSDGSVQPYQSWASFLPLYARIPSPGRADKLFARLLEPAGYWGPQGVRTTPRDDVFFQQAPRVLHFDFKRQARGPVSNWSGPVWVLSNYYMAQGLARYGRNGEARELALKTARMLAAGLGAQGALHECYDDAGVGLWPRQGTFISWNVLALTLLRQLT